MTVNSLSAICHSWAPGGSVRWFGLNSSLAHRNRETESQLEHAWGGGGERERKRGDEPSPLERMWEHLEHPVGPRANGCCSPSSHHSLPSPCKWQSVEWAELTICKGAILSLYHSHTLLLSLSMHFFQNISLPRVNAPLRHLRRAFSNAVSLR